MGKGRKREEEEDLFGGESVDHDEGEGAMLAGGSSKLGLDRAARELLFAAPVKRRVSTRAPASP